MIVKGFGYQTQIWGFLLPGQRELLDLSTIDVILISNYHCMMALPYITEHTGFTGTVYATEPTLQIGRYEDTRHGNSISLVLNGDKARNAAPLPSDCWWRSWWTSWREFPKLSLLPAGKIRKYKGRCECGFFFPFLEELNLAWAHEVKSCVTVTGCSLDVWRTPSMCGPGSAATACRRSTLPSAGCSLSATRRKWWEGFLTKAAAHSRLSQTSVNGFFFLFSFPGVVWSGAGLTFKLRLLAGQLELDHPVSSREGFIRFRLFSAHHAPTGGSAQRRWSESRRAERQTCRVFQPMDQSSLKNSDVLILTGLTQMPTANPDGMLGEFCSNLGQLRQSWLLTGVMASRRVLVFVVAPAAMTIRAGGNVLVPCYSSGVIYDLLECLYQFIESANLGTTPFYFISPVANSSLEFSQIFAEWSVVFISSSLGHLIVFLYAFLSPFTVLISMIKLKVNERCGATRWRYFTVILWP